MVVGQLVYSVFVGIVVGGGGVTSKLIYQKLSLNNLMFDYFHKQIKSAIIAFFFNFFRSFSVSLCN